MNEKETARFYTVDEFMSVDVIDMDRLPRHMPLDEWRECSKALEKELSQYSEELTRVLTDHIPDIVRDCDYRNADVTLSVWSENNGACRSVDHVHMRIDYTSGDRYYFEIFFDYVPFNSLLRTSVHYNLTDCDSPFYHNVGNGKDWMADENDLLLGAQLMKAVGCLVSDDDYMKLVQDTFMRLYDGGMDKVIMRMAALRFIQV